MNISVSEPLSRAWSRMIAALFKPFNLHTWLVVGFTAFLAGLANEYGGGSSGWRGRKNFDFREILGYPRRALEWLNAHPGWVVAIVFAVILAVMICFLCVL